jgi:SAM-dependent methyltransferase
LLCDAAPEKPGMNWVILRPFPRLDTRAHFVSRVIREGSLLDLGSSDGETLNHFAELRPDLTLYSVDKFGNPENYPPGCHFERLDLEKERLPWPDASMDGITCMHLIEHMNQLDLLVAEIVRLLKPGARVYFETPHPRSLTLASLAGSAAGRFTMNFFDDPTHVRLVTMDVLSQLVRTARLEVEWSGISRNWLFAAAHPLFMFLPPSRKKFTAKIHWLGWSACLIARRSP